MEYVSTYIAGRLVQHQVRETGGETESLTTGDRSHHHQGLRSAGDCVGQRLVRRLVRQILLAGEEADERPPLLRGVVANRSAQHRIACLQRVEHRALRRRAVRPRAPPRRRPAPACAGGRAATPGSWQRLHLDGQHGREDPARWRSTCRRRRPTHRPVRRWCRNRCRTNRASRRPSHRAAR